MVLEFLKADEPLQFAAARQQKLNEGKKKTEKEKRQKEVQTGFIKDFIEKIWYNFILSI